MHVCEAIVHSMLCSTCIMKRFYMVLCSLKYCTDIWGHCTTVLCQRWWQNFRFGSIAVYWNTSFINQTRLAIETISFKFIHIHIANLRGRKKRFLKQYLCCNHGYILAKGKNYSYFIDRKIWYFYLKLCMWRLILWHLCHGLTSEIFCPCNHYHVYNNPCF